jgi:hypothetical protein
MWKGALLMAIVSAKRALDPASLLSGTNHFRLEVDVIRFSPFRLYLGTVQVLFAPFQCQTLERGLELLPSGDCEAHSVGKMTFASYAQCHLLQLDASSHPFGCCSLQSLHFTLSPSNWHPGEFRCHRFGRCFRRAGPWRASWCCSMSWRLEHRPGSFPILSRPVRFGWKA